MPYFFNLSRYNLELPLSINQLTAKLFNLNFTHLKLCLADAIHNFKWAKIIQIWQKGGQFFSNLAGWCQILSLTYNILSLLHI